MSDHKDTITGEMTIAEILGHFAHHSQKITSALTHAGLNCTSCTAATWETLEAGMLGHGKSAEEMKKLIEQLNKIIQEKVDLTTIVVTKRAADKFQEIAKEDGKSGWALRFGDTAGGCSGFEYILDFSEKPEADDQVFQSGDLQIHVKKSMVKRLLGSVIDFVDSLYGGGFKISNPNVKSSCGCGKSQGY